MKSMETDKFEKSENAFASLLSEDEEEEEDAVTKKDSVNAFAALANGSNEDEDEEDAVSESKPQGNAFALLMDEEDEDEDDSPKEKDKAQNAFALLMEETEDVPMASKKKSKKKSSPAFDDTFAALEEENGDEKEQVAVKSKKERKPKKKGSLNMEALLDEMEEEEKEPKKEKKPKKKGSLNMEALLDEMEDEEKPVEDRSELETIEAVSKESKKNKKGKKKGSLNMEALLDEMEDEETATVEAVKTEPTEEEGAHPETNGAEADVQQGDGDMTSKDKKKAKKKKKGKVKSKQQSDEDLDAILAELDGDSKPEPPPSKSSPERNTVQDTSIAPQAEQSKASQAHIVSQSSDTDKDIQDEAAEKPPIVDAAEGDGGDPQMETDAADIEEGKETKLTATQKKKQRKKEKKAKEKEKESQKEESKSKNKKVSAHVRMIQEAQERQRQEEERKRLAEEAEKARLEEEERLRQEEEKRKEEEAKRKAEAKAKKEEMIKAGLWMSKKQKAEQKRKAEMGEMLLKNAGISMSGPGHDRPALTPQEQRRIQREREEEKRKAKAAQQAAEEAQRLKEEHEQKQKEAELAEQHRIEEELKRQQEEEDAIADNWEDLSDEETNLQEATENPTEALESPEASKPAEASDGSHSSESSDSESESGSDSEETSSSYSEDSDEARERQVMEAKKKEEARIEEAKASASADNLRSPICCILGHVDTGKTKILDNIRRTNVQDNEAGGITQQIGATYIPSEALQTRTADLRKGRDYDMKVPGLLVIDTPGHESFTNLRSRGSSLCDIAILVVDLMHGLEAQTVESIELLRQKKTPFIIALNKVDRLNDWKVVPNAPIRDTLNRQKKHTMLHFEDRLQTCTTMLMERGLNVSLYWKNKEPRRIVNMVPTSAITGEGIPDMLQLLIKLTTSLMAEQLMFLKEVQCSVLEVKAVEGLGTTIDVVLVNGELNEGDRIVVCGMTGPIVTTIRSLLTPHPLKELRVKGSFLHHKSILAAQGIKICAQNLEHAVAGTALRVVREGEEETCKLLAQEEMEDVMSRIDKSGEGVSVQASTLGSLEALLEFLKTPEVSIPVSAIAIGPVHKKDVMRANVMNEKKLKKFGVILAFDVPVTKEARELSDELGVKIFTADIIYHLFDQFKAYVEDVRQAEKRAAAEDAVFPCILSILPTCIFNTKNPIILGCDVIEGQARIGTPLIVKPGAEMISLGRIESMELNHKSVEKAQRGDSIAIKIKSTSPEEASRLYGRHFDHTDRIISHISRPSINALKAFFKDEMSTDDWNLVVKLKKVFQVE